MKPLILTLIALFISLNGWAQTTTITYQGKLLDASGNPVTNSSMPMTFAIYSAETGGTKLWPSGAAAAKTVDVDYGLYTVTLGTGSGTDEAFTSAVFAGGTAWLEVSVNGTTLARTRLTTVPFSYFSGALEGKTWAAPGAIGATTPGTGKFTNLTVGAYSFPSADGSNGQVLTTDGSGTLSWADASSFDPASPGNIGGTTPADACFTSINIEAMYSAPLTPKDYTSTNLDRPISVNVSGGYAYVVSRDNNRFCIFDISDPDNVTAKDYTSANLSNPKSVYVSGSYAYVVSSSNNRLCAFDISNPDNITPKDYISTNISCPSSVYVSGGYAYVISECNGRLCIYDISDPDNIVAKDYISTNLSCPKSVYVSGGYAYVTSVCNDRLCIYDISDPDNIVAKDYIGTNLDRPISVYVSGNYAYVISFDNNRLCTYDISDPDNITAKNYISTNISGPKSVYVSGSYAYVVSTNNNHLSVFNIHNPDNIVAKGYTNANLNSPNSVFVSRNFVFVASLNNNRLCAYEINHVETPAINAGSIGAGDMDIADNVKIGNDLHVRGGLNAGNTLVQGDLSVENNTKINGGLTVGDPTGGNQGDGTINAEAVYDDNVLLTDYVFDWYFGGRVLECDMEKHADYRMLSLQEMIDFTRENRHLPTITGREEWEKYGKLPLGILTNQIWETVETQAIYIMQLKEENEKMKQENEKLKNEMNENIRKQNDKIEELNRKLNILINEDQ